MLNLFFVNVIFIVQPCINENDDQLPGRVVGDGASRSRNCSTAHTDIHNKILVPSGDSIRQLVCHFMDKKELIHLQLDHDRELDFFMSILKI